MKEEQWKVAHVTHEGKLVHNSVMKMQMMSEALKRGYDETAEITGCQYLQTGYTKNEDEYLVSGAQLKCTIATTEKMTIEGREYIPENPSEITYLECEENLMESGEDKVNATTKDCVVYKNIKPFRCNCKVKPCDTKERSMLLNNKSCLSEGTCKALIDLSEHWDNYPSQVPHFRYNDERFGAVYKVTLSSEKEIYVTQGDVKAEEHTVESKNEEGKNYYAGEGGSANTLEFICNYNNKNSEFFSSNMVNETGTDRNAGKANSIMEGASIIKIELMLDYEIDWESYFKEEE